MQDYFGEHGGICTLVLMLSFSNIDGLQLLCSNVFGIQGFNAPLSNGFQKNIISILIIPGTINPSIRPSVTNLPLLISNITNLPRNLLYGENVLEAEVGGVLLLLLWYNMNKAQTFFKVRIFFKLEFFLKPRIFIELEFVLSLNFICREKSSILTMYIFFAGLSASETGP